MNNQMFFYPLYPYGDENDYIEERSGGKELFTPGETLEYGNIFKNEYKGYKNYKPRKLNQNNELVNLMALQNYCHDLKLHIDIYPNDSKIVNLQKEAHKKYLEAKSMYESKNNDFFKYL